MAVKISSIPRILLTLAGFAVLAIVLYIGWVYYQVKFVEPREYDHIPELLSDQVQLTKISENEYDSPEYKDGEMCTRESAETILDAVGYVPMNPSAPSFEDNPLHEERFCTVFDVGQEKMYFLWPRTFEQFLVIEQSVGNYEIAMKQVMYGDPRNASSFSNMKSNGRTVVFSYSGYGNPEKHLKLSFAN